LTPADFIVNSLGDGHDAIPGDGVADTGQARMRTTTLRAAIEEGNALGGSHTITFAVTGDIRIVNDQLELRANFTIDGPTAASVVLWPLYSLESEYRIMEVKNSSTSTIADLVFNGGYDPANDGGGILNNGVLELNHCTVQYCQANHGGGIANLKQLWLNNTTIGSNWALNEGGGISTAANANSQTHVLSGSTITGNSAGNQNVGGKGGGLSIETNAQVEIDDSAIAGNSSTDIGGGIYSSGGILTMQNGATLSGNSAVNGGGVYVATGTANLTDVTISSNSASAWGGGLYVEPASTVNLTDSTFSSNTAGTGGPKIAYGGVLGGTVFITIDNCSGFTDPDDLIHVT
jgi:hypothetical protein